jgi:hypothetical protein
MILTGAAHETTEAARRGDDLPRATWRHIWCGPQLHARSAARISGIPIATAFLLMFATAACDPGPTAPEVPLMEDAPAQAVAGHWHQLPALESLHLGTVQTLAGGSAHGAADDPELAVLLEGLGMMAAEASDMRRGQGAAWGTASGAALELAVDEAWLALTGAVLGVSGAATIVEGVAAALEAFGEAVASAEASTTSTQGAAQAAGARAEAARRLQAARQARLEAQRRMAAARAALASGRAGAAVAEATAAAEALKSTLPEDRVAAFVSAAKALLERAEMLAGPTPAPEIAALLDEAGDLCRAAAAALDGGDLREAVTLASRCARISRIVIARLSAGVPDDALADRAAQAVEQAESLYERAVEAAGPTPSPTVAEALEEARAFLADAQASLAAGEWREAIRAAQASSAISRRILAGAAGGDDGLEARAEAVVTEARTLLSQAEAEAGAAPPPAIQQLLNRASALVAEAEAALQAGDFRVAIVKATQALPLLRRVLLAGSG